MLLENEPVPAADGIVRSTVWSRRCSDSTGRAKGNANLSQCAESWGTCRRRHILATGGDSGLKVGSGDHRESVAGWVGP